MEELRKLTTYWAAQGDPLPLVLFHSSRHFNVANIVGNNVTDLLFLL